MVSIRLGLLLGSMVCAGCFSDHGLVGATGSTSGSTTTSTTATASGTTSDTSIATTGTTSSATADPTTTEAGGSETTGDLTTSTTDITTSGPSSTTGWCGDPPGQAQDATCTDKSGCGCASGHCFVMPLLGGFCGECLDDGDCPNGGCTVPNPLKEAGSFCNPGGPGDGCNTDAACASASASHCGLVFSAAPVFEVSTCGECKADADCTAQTPLCNPSYDVPELSGMLECVAKNSVPNNQGCASDDACASGRCGEATAMAVLKLGVCGECLSDSDCNQAESCTDPQIDLESGTLVGAVCI